MSTHRAEGLSQATESRTTGIYLGVATILALGAVVRLAKLERARLKAIQDSKQDLMESIKRWNRATFRVETPLITISPRVAASACSEVCQRSRHDGKNDPFRAWGSLSFSVPIRVRSSRPFNPFR